MGFGVVLSQPLEWRVLNLGLAMRPFPQSSLIIDEWIRRDAELDSLPLYETTFNGPERHETEVFYNNLHGAESRLPVYCSNRQAVFTQLDVLSRFATKEAQEIILAVVTEFQEALRNIIFLDLDPRAMVDYSFNY